MHLLFKVLTYISYKLILDHCHKNCSHGIQSKVSMILSLKYQMETYSSLLCIFQKPNEVPIMLWMLHSLGVDPLKFCNCPHAYLLSFWWWGCPTIDAFSPG